MANNVSNQARSQAYSAPTATTSIPHDGSSSAALPQSPPQGAPIVTSVAAAQSPQFSEQQVSELFAAARNGDLEAVRSLVTSGISADATLKNNLPPIVRAAKSGHLAVVKFLHKNGASENSRYTALKALAFDLASESDPAARENMDAIATELLFSFSNPEAACNQVVMELQGFDAGLAAEIDRLLRFEG